MSRTSPASLSWFLDKAKCCSWQAQGQRGRPGCAQMEQRLRGRKAEEGVLLASKPCLVGRVGGSTWQDLQLKLELI